MNDVSVVPICAVKARIEAISWPWAEREAGRIAAHWHASREKQPDLFDGRVLLAHQWSVHNGIFKAHFFETDFSAFLAWKSWDFPDRTVTNTFSMAALKSSDGAFVLGRMGEHTANAGKIYFPAGTPDPQDCLVDGTVDLAGSVLRELEEETGITPSDIDITNDWALVTDTAQIALMREIRSPLAAADLKAKLLDNIHHQTKPEFQDIVIVRSPSDLDRVWMPRFVLAYLDTQLAG